MNEYNFKNYVSLPRWISYYEQIGALENLSPKRILEIGLGSRLVYAILKELGFNIIGLDNNKELKPDVVGDIRDLESLFKKGEFDCVCCFQVLEHLPFCEFESFISSISKITSKYAIISLPYAGYTIATEFRISKIGERALSFVFRLPRFWEKHKYDGMHYWEIGKYGFSMSVVVKILKKHFEIKEKKLIRPNKAIAMFILRKK